MFQGLGCSPIKAVRELGSERRETVRSISGVGVRALRGPFPSTRGPGRTHLWCASYRAHGYSGEQISSGDDGVGPVAQRIRARGYEPRCRGFESLLAHNRPKKGRIFPSGGRKIMIGLADPKLWNL
ncbi:hypothetical protein JHK82_040914 [Glycine max]|nr:hypothetical protein JHK82_040914 [Glycine max]